VSRSTELRSATPQSAARLTLWGGSWATLAATALSLACCGVSAAEPPRAQLPREPVTARPPTAERPEALCARWCGLGLCLVLSASGESQVLELSEGGSDDEGGRAERVLERGLWWVEADQLCLTAGLNTVCEPYQLLKGGLNLTREGLKLTLTRLH